jgi:hypothetical protein
MEPDRKQQEEVDRRLRDVGYSLDEVSTKLSRRTNIPFDRCKLVLVFANGHPRSAENLLLMARHFRK